MPMILPAELGHAFIAHPSCRIANPGAIIDDHVTRGTTVYAATKHGMRVISEGLRQEVKPYNIRTTIISPGAIATELPDSVSVPEIAAGIRPPRTIDPVRAPPALAGPWPDLGPRATPSSRAMRSSAA
jgi:NAD(P)-dependent dehydrogenase (short-subunit alcohol dehydrogenase family)